MAFIGQLNSTVKCTPDSLDIYLVSHIHYSEKCSPKLARNDQTLSNGHPKLVVNDDVLQIHPK